MGVDSLFQYAKRVGVQAVCTGTVEVVARSQAADNDFSFLPGEKSIRHIRALRPLLRLKHK